MFKYSQVSARSTKGFGHENLALLQGAEEETKQQRTVLSELIVTLLLGDRVK